MEQRAELVCWPDGRARRAALAEAGTPCLLVLASGVAVPSLLAREDWISANSDERDVANRLGRLARTASARTGSTGSVVPVLPPDLSADQHRVAARLAASVDRLVPKDDLPVDGLDDVIGALRAALASLGFEITSVGDAGYLLERSGATT